MTKHPCLELPDHLRRVNEPRDEIVATKPGPLRRALARWLRRRG